MADTNINKDLVEDIKSMFDISSDSGDSNDYDVTESDSIGQKDFTDLADELSDDIEGFESPSLPVNLENDSIEEKEETIVKDNNDSADQDQKAATVKDNNDVEEQDGEEMPETEPSESDLANIENMIKNEISKPTKNEDDVDLDALISNPVENQEVEEKVEVDKGKVKDNVEEDVSGEDLLDEKIDLQQAKAEESPKRQETPADESSKEKDDIGIEKAERQTVAKEGNMAIKSTDTNNNEWLLESPADKYDRFYEHKKSVLPRLLVNGPIPFNQYGDTLRKANVEIDTRNYSAQDAYEGMTKVQRWSSRVQEIFLHANDQIHVWDAFIEMMQGMLVRIEPNIKPAEARKALFFEHLRDFQYYYSKLRSTHGNANAVLKNLEAARDTFSRRITIFTAGQKTESDRTSFSAPSPDHSSQKVEQPKKENVVQQSSEDIDDFDTLDGKATISKKKPATDFVDW